MMNTHILQYSNLWKRLAGLAIGGLTTLLLVSLLHAQTPYEAHLSGRHQVSPVTTQAEGMITATLEGNQLTVTGSFDNLSSVYAASHIHMAVAGSNGGVEIGLDPTVDTDEMGGTYEAENNTFTLTSEQQTALQERRFYVNVHSANHPSGEIRGQLHPEAEAYYYSLLSGTHSMPSVNSRAHGAIAAELHGDELVLTGSFSGLSSEYSASHIHVGMAGSNGGVEVGLSATVGEDNSSATYLASDNSFTLNATQKTALNQRNLYVNIHSSQHAAGEIRGQLVPSATATFYAQLSGSAEVPSVESSGRGAVLIELHGDTLVASGTFAELSSDFNSEIAGGAHLHNGPAGRNAGVDLGLTADVESNMRTGAFMATDNTFELSADQKATLMDRGYYVNIHTTGHPSGEIRGQALAEATAYFTANLSGNNEVQPVQTTGQGSVNLEVRDSTVTATGSFSGLISAYNTEIAGGSHLHMGPIDGNGGVKVGLNPTIGNNDTSGVYTASNNTYTLSTDNIEALHNEMLYVNIHTTAYAAGEIRGQAKLRPNAMPTRPELTSPDDGATVVIEGDADNNIQVSWNSASDADDDNVAYVWELASDAEFNNVVTSMNVGSNTQTNLTYGLIDTLLMDVGIDIGTSADLYHRVRSTDGSEQNPGEARMVTFERGTITAIPGDSNELPDRVTLDQNYPNPFNPATEIRFSLPEASDVTITVYNELGRKVAQLINQRMTAGSHSVEFDGSGLATGLYIYRLQTPEASLTRKMMLLK